MKKRSVQVVAFGILVCLCLIYWLRQPHVRQKDVHEGAVSSDKNTSSPNVIDGSGRNDAPQNPSVAPSKELNELKEKREAQIEASIEHLNVPIVFWGKVVDQENQPLEQVKVIFHYMSETVGSREVAWSSSQRHSADVFTKSDGSFSISGIHGTYLAIEALEKPGFVPSNRFPANGLTFNYSGRTASKTFTSNRDNPEMFLMIKNNAVETLTHFSTQVALEGDGRPARVDIVSGKRSDAGELEIGVRRDPPTLVPGQTFKWTAFIKLVGGGVLPMPLSAAFIAPETGYDPNGGTWTTVRSKSFYVRTAGGKYGRIDVTVYADDEGSTARCYIESFFNPSGSPNLEYIPPKTATHEPVSR